MLNISNLAFVKGRVILKKWSSGKIDSKFCFKYQVSIYLETLSAAAYVSQSRERTIRARSPVRARAAEPCEKSNNRQGRKRGRRAPGVARSVEFTEARCSVSEVISAAKGQLAPLSGSRLWSTTTCKQPRVSLCARESRCARVWPALLPCDTIKSYDRSIFVRSTRYESFARCVRPVRGRNISQVHSREKVDAKEIDE